MSQICRQCESYSTWNEDGICNICRKSNCERENRRLTARVAELEGELREFQHKYECMELEVEHHLKYAAKAKLDKKQAEAELAKLREASLDLDIERSINRSMSEPAPCGHYSFLSHSEDGGKHIYCYRCEKEQAEAELAKSYADVQNLRVWLAEIKEQWLDAKRELDQSREELKTAKSDLKQFLKDTVDEMECLPTCDSYMHDENCPVANPQAAWRNLRDELAKLRESEHPDYVPGWSAKKRKDEP